MLKDNISNIQLKGHVTITSSKDSNKLLEENNYIATTALELLLRCVTNKGGNHNVDIVKATGDFGTVNSTITNAEYNSYEGSIKLTAVIAEDAFIGTINTLELRCSTLNKNLAVKDGLVITKESNIRLQIDWKIFIR